MSRSFAIAAQCFLLGLCWSGLLLALPGLLVMRAANHMSNWIAD